MIGRAGLPLPQNPAADRPVGSVWVGRLGIIAGLTVLAALAAIFFYAPTERIQGDVQRVFYIHVPLAFNAYGSFAIVLVASILYLWKRNPVFDRWARSAAEIGVIFTTLVLVTGSIWAKPIWGTWWTWDARLTTTLVLWLVYLAYLVVRAYIDDPHRAARYSAILGIIGFINVPIINQSVVWWRTLHPGKTIIQESGGTGLTPPMMITLILALVAVSLVQVYLLFLKVQIETAKDARRERRLALLED